LTLPLKDDVVTFLNKTRQCRKKAQCESDVSVLKALPQTILMRLHLEVHSPVIERHAFFKQCAADEPYMIHRLCHCAMSEQAVGVGEELFRLGVRCSCMYFAISGECRYVVGIGGDDRPLTVWPGQWLCEAALWVEWEHRGQLNANSACQLSQLDAQEFANIMTGSRVLQLIQRYAGLYAHHLEKENGGAENATDLWGQRMRVVDLVQQAFQPEDDDGSPTSRAIMLRSGQTVSLHDAFLFWKHWTTRRRRWARLWRGCWKPRAQTS